MLTDTENTELNILPFSPKAEEALIGCAFIDPEVARTISLSPEDFYLTRTRTVWDAIKTLSDQKKNIDTLTVYELIESRGKSDEINGLAYLIDCLNNVPSALHAETYAETIEELALRRKVIEDANKLATAGYDRKADLNSVISEIITSLATRTNSKHGAEHIKSFVSSFYDDILKRCEKPVPFGGVSGIPTGLIDLDEAMDGFQLGEEVILSAPPGKGKSLLAFQMVSGMADHAPGAVYELEMSVNTLIGRDISGRAKISTKAMRRGWVKDEEWAAFTQAIETLAGKEIYVTDETNWNVLKLRADLARLKERANIKWFMLDYMDLLKDVHGKDDIERTKWISTQIHDICKDLNLAGLVINAMTKAGMKENDGSQTSLGGSGKIISDADQIIFLMHDESEPTVYRLKWGKMRNGNFPEDVALFRMAGSTRFENAARARI